MAEEQAEIIEAQVEEPGTEVAVPDRQAAVNLFHTSDPAEVLKRAVSTANALMPVVREKELIARIGNKDHLTVEAWQTLGAMLGVTPVCTWTRKLENGWEARVEARTLDGRVIGAAEAECLTAETRWADADDYAVRSMAQTRATSKALASVLRFVATLGGAAGTPAEEMPRGAQRRNPGPSPKQLGLLERLLKEAGATADTARNICSYAEAKFEGGRDGSMSKAIDRLVGDDKKVARATAKALAEKAKEWSEQQSDLPPPDMEGLPDNVPDESVPSDEQKEFAGL